MSIPSDTLATLRKLRQTFADGRPDSGQRYFPDAGTHKALVMGITLGRDTAKSGNVELPVTTVTFQFKQLGDTTADGKDRDFSGKTFFLPDDPAAYIPQGGKKATRFSIDRDRLLGHLDVILDSGGTPPPLDEALEILNSKLTAKDAVVMVELYADHRAYKDKDGKDRVEHVEKLQKLLTS